MSIQQLSPDLKGAKRRPENLKIVIARWENGRNP